MANIKVAHSGNGHFNVIDKEIKVQIVSALLEDYLGITPNLYTEMIPDEIQSKVISFYEGIKSELPKSENKEYLVNVTNTEDKNPYKIIATKIFRP